MKTSALAVWLAVGVLGPVVAGAQDRSMERGGMMGEGGMMGRDGMMGQSRLQNLKELPAERLAKSVRYCDRKYAVATAAGDVFEFREFDLRFKTDAGDHGPRRGTPALLSAGGMGDRAFLIFSDPSEISGYIEKKCSDG